MTFGILSMCVSVCLVLLQSMIIHIPAVLSETQNDLGSQELYQVEGRILQPNPSMKNWQHELRILVNGGEHLGFMKEDGSFVINNLPSGSYIIEVSSPNFYYEPVRVEINSKGRFRARKVNHIQTSQVIQVPYPLKLQSLGKMKYFQPREQWRITDILLSPMVMMMVLPMLIIMILPKMMSDPETKKEMQQLNNITQFRMPEMSEMMTSLFGSGQGRKDFNASGNNLNKVNKKKQTKVALTVRRNNK